MKPRTVISHLLGFLLLMIFESLAQVCFKYTTIAADPFEVSWSWLLRVFGHWWIYGALLGYICAFFAWMTLLRRVAVGPAFAASHLEVVSTIFLSYYLFDESLTLAKLLGAVCILAGIGCLALAEHRLAQQSNQDVVS